MNEKKRIKYWLFYLISDSLIGKLLPYAYTDNKKMAVEFKEQRDMSKFYIKEKKLSIEDVNNITRRYQRGYLQYIKLLARDDNCKSKEIQLVCTEDEKSMYHSMEYSVLLPVVELVWDNPFTCFKSEYQDALAELEYYLIRRLYRSKGGIGLSEKIMINQLAIFMELINNTL